MLRGVNRVLVSKVGLIRRNVDLAYTNSLHSSMHVYYGIGVSHKLEGVKLLNGRWGIN